MLFKIPLQFAGKTQCCNPLLPLPSISSSLSLHHFIFKDFNFLIYTPTKNDHFKYQNISSPISILRDILFDKDQSPSPPSSINKIKTLFPFVLVICSCVSFDNHLNFFSFSKYHLYGAVTP
eukprot:UN04592